jgi:hypothetical protein
MFFLLPGVIAITLAVCDEIVVTWLLRREYTQHRETWESDGKPRGVFWIPDECKIGTWYITYASGHAGQLVRWRWLVKMPNWISEDPEARRLLVLHRIFLPAFLTCMAAPFAIAMLIQSRGA